MIETYDNSLASLDENLGVAGEPVGSGMLPIDGLPKVARDIIKYYEKSLQCPRDYLVASVFSAISLAMGSMWKITDGNFFEYANLYVALVGDAGAGKSKPISKIFSPLEEIEKCSMIAYDNDVQNELTKPVDKRRKIHAKEYILRNSTPEATTDALKYNQKGLIQYSDELSSFLTGRGMYNGNFDSGELNTMYDGNCSIKRSRKTEGISYAEKCYYSIIGGIQPQIVTRKFNEDDMINGFLFRFLFVYPDDMRKEYKNIHPELNEEVPQNWREFILNIHQGFNSELSVEIPFSPEALKLATEFHNRNAVDKYNATQDSSEKSIYAKSTQQLYKLCLIVAFANSHNPVTKGDVEYTIRCMDYFIKCAFKVQALFPITQEKKKVTSQEVLKLFCEQFGIDGSNYRDANGNEVNVIDALAKATNKSKETIRTMIKRCGFSPRNTEVQNG